MASMALAAAFILPDASGKAERIQCDPDNSTVTLIESKKDGILHTDAVELDAVFDDVLSRTTDLDEIFGDLLGGLGDGVSATVIVAGSSPDAAAALFGPVAGIAGPRTILDYVAEALEELNAGQSSAADSISMSVSAIACATTPVPEWAHVLYDLLSARPQTAGQGLTVQCLDEEGTWVKGVTSVPVPSATPSVRGSVTGKGLAATCHAALAAYEGIARHAGREGGRAAIVYRVTVKAEGGDGADRADGATSATFTLCLLPNAHDVLMPLLANHTEIRPSAVGGDKGYTLWPEQPGSSIANDVHDRSRAGLDASSARTLVPCVVPGPAFSCGDDSLDPLTAILADCTIGSNCTPMLVLALREGDPMGGPNAADLSRSQGTWPALQLAARMRTCAAYAVPNTPAAVGLLASHRAGSRILRGAFKSLYPALLKFQQEATTARQEALDAEDRAAAAAQDAATAQADAAALRTELQTRPTHEDFEDVQEEMVSIRGTLSKRGADLRVQQLKIDELEEELRHAMGDKEDEAEERGEMPMPSRSRRYGLTHYVLALRARLALLTPDAVEREQLESALTIQSQKAAPLEERRTLEDTLLADFARGVGTAAILFPSVSLAEATAASASVTGKGLTWDDRSPSKEGEAGEGDGAAASSTSASQRLALRTAAASVDVTSGRYLTYAEMVSALRDSRRAATENGQLRTMCETLRAHLLAARDALSTARDEKDRMRRFSAALRGKGTASAPAAVALQATALEAVSRIDSGDLNVTQVAGPAGLAQADIPHAALLQAVKALRAQTGALHARCTALGMENERLGAVVSDASTRLCTLSAVMELSHSMPAANTSTGMGAGTVVGQPATRLAAAVSRSSTTREPSDPSSSQVLSGPSGLLMSSLRKVEDMLVALLSSNAVLAARAGGVSGGTAAVVTAYEAALSSAQVEIGALRSKLAASGGK